MNDATTSQLAEAERHRYAHDWSFWPSYDRTRPPGKADKQRRRRQRKRAAARRDFYEESLSRP